MIESPNIGLPYHKTFIVSYLGMVPYEVALQAQERLRQLRAVELIPDAVLLLQHPHVYTAGRFRGGEDIITPTGNIPVVPTNRGGGITYHGPGQLVGYPVLNLRANGLGLREYIWRLEEVIIRLLRVFGIEAEHNEEYPGGVWVNEHKICSIGINVSRHITMHGFALNINNDLRYFDHIRPCGMRGAAMTSMSKLLGGMVPLDMVVDEWVNWFSDIFELRQEMHTALPVEEVAIA